MNPTNSRVARARLGLLAVGLSFAAAGCQSTNPNVSHGRYNTPDGVLSVAVPELGPGLVIEGTSATDPRNGTHNGWISFHDDAARLRAVTYTQLTPDQRSEYADAAHADQANSLRLHKGYLPEVSAHFPKTTATNEEPLTLADGTRALFVVIHLPGGSTVMVRDPKHPTGTRMDTSRASLMFSREGVFILLDTADDFAFGRALPETRPTEPSPEELAQWKRELTELYATVQVH